MSANQISEQSESNAAEAVEVAPIVARLTEAQKRGLLAARSTDGALILHGSTARALQLRGIVRDMQPGGGSAQARVTLTSVGCKVYRALHGQGA